MKKKIAGILIVFLIILLLIFKSEKNAVKITGYLENMPDSTIIKISKSVNEYPENYLFMSDSVLVINNYFSKTIKLKETGIITLESTKGFPKSHLVVEKNDKIVIQIEKNKNQFKVIFKGKNRKGQSLFHESKLLSSNFMSQKIIYKIAPVSLSNKDFIDRMESLKDSLLKPFTNLLNKNQISKSFYDVVKAEGEGRFLSSVNNAILYNIKRDSISLIDYNENEILRYFFTKYDPFSDKYKNINLLTRMSNVSKKGILISKGILKGDKNLTPLWDSIQNVNSYASIDIQEKIKANYIVIDRVFKIKTYKESLKEFILFKKTFPNSFYLKNLSKHFIKNINNNLEQPYTFGVLLNRGDKLVAKKFFKGSDLDSLIKYEFNNKYVFVDIWATWCSPCIKEFSYSNALHNYLKNNNIEMLYVSVDSKTAGKKWEDKLVEYSIEGYHFFATNDLNKYFRKWEMNKTIPKYILYNKQGLIIDNNLPKPSSNNDLYDRINELIKTSD